MDLEKSVKESEPKKAEVRTLDVFLNPEPLVKEVKFLVSERFKDSDGKPVYWSLKSISESHNEKIIKACQRRIKGKRTDELDRSLYGHKLLEATVVYPDCHDQTLMAHYGVLQPHELFAAMLSVGEYSELTRAVLELNGLNDDDSENLIEEAKN
jgi:hypothetical protein